MAAAVRLTHLAPVLIVDSVEPCLAFWVDRLGFEAKNQVPGPDGQLVFASVEKDGIEVMYQTRASVLADSPASASELVGHSTVLFITVPDLDSVERAVAGAPLGPALDLPARFDQFYVTAPVGERRQRRRRFRVRSPAILCRC